VAAGTLAVRRAAITEHPLAARLCCRPLVCPPARARQPQARLIGRMPQSDSVIGIAWAGVCVLSDSLFRLAFVSLRAALFRVHRLRRRRLRCRRLLTLRSSCLVIVTC
jgi:hypothetical protein